jgi:hypothetical protein
LDFVPKNFEFVPSGLDFILRNLDFVPADLDFHHRARLRSGRAHAGSAANAFTL